MSAHNYHHFHLACFICTHMMEDGLPILHVVHDEGGDWQFLCGGENHLDESTYRVACLECVVDRHPDIIKTLDLPERAWAERSSTEAEWQFRTLD